MPRKLSLAALGALLLFASSDAAAVDNGACCLQSTSRLDALLNPTKGSDESFFTSPGGPPNIMLLVDTSCSMKAWPKDWPTTKGCSHTGFVAGYDPSTEYPGLMDGVSGASTEDEDWFNRAKFYEAPGSSSFGDGDPYAHDFAPSGAPQNTLTWTTRTDACATADIGSGDRTLCADCLRDKGYYVQDSDTRRVSGNFLNYYGPRDVSATMVLSQLVKDVRTVRLGIITFDPWPSTNTTCWGDTICLFEEMNPKCGETYPFDDSSVSSNRGNILGRICKNNSWSTRTPLSATLYAAGHYLRSASSPPTATFPSGYATNSAFNEGGATNQQTICGSCGFNAVILLTDGSPNEEDYISIPSTITSPAVTDCTGGNCSSKMDEVARWMWNSDFRNDYTGKQRIAVYTVGFATDSDANGILQSTANAGGGRFFSASNTAALKSAIMTIIDDVASRNISFSSAAVSTVQSGSASEGALLPRLQPRKSLPWLGSLWRFEQYNEFKVGVELASKTDSDLDDIFITDSLGRVVTEDTEGKFIIASAGNAPASAFWEAGDQLRTRATARNIWTALDSSGPASAKDGAFTHHDSPLTAFTAANAGALTQYLGIVGTTFCPVLAGSDGKMLLKFGLTASAAGGLLGLPFSTQPELDLLCVTALIEYVRGKDLADEDQDSIRNEVRPSVLGDIFHSSPVVVTPPVDSFLCDLGLSNQCVRTLYSDTLGVTATPLKSYAETDCSGGAKSRNAYESYAYANRSRDKLVVVGANDGMLHAFHNGEGTTACASGTNTETYDQGTGAEVWAFIPPDLLPRLQDMVLEHAYYVDGDLMVRDIWADGSGASATLDGHKDKDEYHTMAIAAEGRGGTHYFAVEVLFDSSGNSLDRPGFRWMFPQPCSKEASTFGKTFYALSPKPPPVGPVLIAGNTLSPAQGGVTRYGVTNTVEQWVVALSGGWSPSLDKGRGIYLVDAWQGVVNGRSDNLWWKFEFDHDASGDTGTPAKFLTHSVTAPVAMVDYGGNDAPGQDGYFDTAVVGDTAGNVWIARMFEPGRVSGGLISNWAAGRSFEMDRFGVTVGTDEDLGTTSQKSTVNEWPFYYLPSVGINNNEMRVFIGTGNRYALLEPNAGTCRFDNPLACSKYKCDDVKTVYQISKNTLNVSKNETHWKSQKFEHGKYDSSTIGSPDICGTPGGAATVTAAYSEFKVNSCDQVTGPDVSFGEIHRATATCSQTADGGSFNCRRTDSNTDVLENLPFTPDLTGLGKNRFYGFWAYGKAPGRKFGEDGGLTPKVFDERRLTDRNVNPPEADLVNVSNVTCTSGGVCTPPSGDGGWGWFLDYPALADKTASGAAVMASCVLWSTLSPTGGGDGGICQASSSPSSRLYQADFFTGAPNCAAGFKRDAGWARFEERSVVAPPPEPAATIQISASGQVKYSAMLVEPGKEQATQVDIASGQDNLQQVYELAVSRSLHTCRHVMDGGCVIVPP